MNKLLLVLLFPALLQAGGFMVPFTSSSSSSGGTWGSITGTLSSQTDLQTALDARVADTGNETVAGNKSFTGTTTFGSASKYAYFNGAFSEIALLFHNTVATDFGFYAYSDGGLYGVDTTYGDALKFNFRANGDRITLLGTTANIACGGTTCNLGSSGSPMAAGYFKGPVVTSNAALATSATTGHFYIPTSAGTPTGVPAALTGTVALQYDTSGNQLCVYNGAWKCVAFP